MNSPPVRAPNRLSANNLAPASLIGFEFMLKRIIKKKSSKIKSRGLAIFNFTYTNSRNLFPFRIYSASTAAPIWVMPLSSKLISMQIQPLISNDTKSSSSTYARTWVIDRESRSAATTALTPSSPKRFSHSLYNTYYWSVDTANKINNMIASCIFTNRTWLIPASITAAAPSLPTRFRLSLKRKTRHQTTTKTMPLL